MSPRHNWLSLHRELALGHAGHLEFVAGAARREPHRGAAGQLYDYLLITHTDPQRYRRGRLGYPAASTASSRTPLFTCLRNVRNWSTLISIRWPVKSSSGQPQWQWQQNCITGTICASVVM